MSNDKSLVATPFLISSTTVTCSVPNSNPNIDFSPEHMSGPDMIGEGIMVCTQEVWSHKKEEKVEDIFARMSKISENVFPSWVSGIPTTTESMHTFSSGDAASALLPPLSVFPPIGFPAGFGITQLPTPSTGGAFGGYIPAPFTEYIPAPFTE